jgi:cytochrome P450
MTPSAPSKPLTTIGTLPQAQPPCKSVRECTPNPPATIMTPAHPNPSTGNYNFSKLNAIPFLQSLHTETTRMYSITLVARKVLSPVFALDDKYVAPKGTQIVIPSRYAGQ